MLALLLVGCGSCKTTPEREVCPDFRNVPNPTEPCCACAELFDAGCGVMVCTNEDGETCRPCVWLN